jgi:DNA-binding transcriptional ArsR family regulator
MSGLPLLMRSRYLSIMIGNMDIAVVGSLVGDPARANILCALLDGRALTATELAYAAGVSPQTTSGHLAKLIDANLIAVQPQGRHRYYRLADPQVGRMLEAIVEVAAHGQKRHRPRAPTDEALRQARTCYDHLAGLLGVALADALQERGCVVLGEDGGEVTAAGHTLFARFGLDLSPANSRRVFCRPCIDWTERRPHLAGLLGAALARRCFELGFVERMPKGRALTITPAGRRGFSEVFGVRL